MTRFLVAAAHKSSGKTIVSTGLCAALTQQGLRVQPFKKGPDYIDPLWLSRAAGRPCINLDFNTMSPEEIRGMVGMRSQSADIALIEANKGLYDGLALDGSNSNAALAELLETPVVLVLDCRGSTRGVAPLLLGYRAFGPQLRFAGVILNRVGGARHASKLRSVIAAYTDFTVLGALDEDPELQIPERHLGLIPSNEHAAADAQIQRLGQRIAEQVDVQRLREAVGTVSRLPEALHASDLAPAPALAPALPTSISTSPVRIAIARDAAFGFYYPTDLEALERAGAHLQFFDTLTDRTLPPAEALFIGGGFPETQMEALERNGSMRQSIRTAIEAGMPAYAECGGLMYLAQGLHWQGKRCAMAGVLPGEVHMHRKPQGKGYVLLEETAAHPWPGASGTPLPAHEFHYSSLEGGTGTALAYRMRRGHGLDGQSDGIVYKNLLANYVHLQHTRQHPWANRFVDFIRQVHG